MLGLGTVLFWVGKLLKVRVKKYYIVAFEQICYSFSKFACSNADFHCMLVVSNLVYPNPSLLPVLIDMTHYQLNITFPHQN